MMTDLDRAIEDAEYGRYTHQNAVDYIEGCVSCGCEDCLDYKQKMDDFGGNLQHQEDWIKKYDNIISCLKNMKVAT